MAYSILENCYICSWRTQEYIHKLQIDIYQKASRELLGLQYQLTSVVRAHSRREEGKKHQSLIQQERPPVCGIGETLCRSNSQKLKPNWSTIKLPTIQLLTPLCIIYCYAHVADAVNSHWRSKQIVEVFRTSSDIMDIVSWHPFHQIKPSSGR